MRKEGTQALRCELTSFERNERLGHMATRLDEVEQLEGEFKDLADDYKGRIKAKQGTVAEIREVLRLGELRDVQVETHYDFAASIVTVVRMDTGEEIGRRPMNEMDRQLNLPTDSPTLETSPGEQLAQAQQ